MRPLGITGAPILVTDAGSGVRLQAGVLVSLRVLEALSPGVYRVEVGGRVLMARSALNLPPASLLQARVEKSEGGTGLVLRLDPASLPAAERTLDGLVLKTGLALDSSSRLAALALLSEGLKASPSALGRVRQSALKAGSDDGEERAGLAARLEAKGLSSSPESVDALLSILESGDSYGGDGEGMEARQEEGSSRGEAALVERTIPEKKLAAELGRFIKSLCFEARGEESGEALGRVGPAAGRSSARALLGLFNHARAAGRNWILVPFRFSLDSVAFAGSFRILLPYIYGGPGRIEASFRAAKEEGRDRGEGDSAEAEGDFWAFELSFGSGPPRLVIHPGERKREAEAILADLGAELLESGCKVSLEDRSALSEPGGLSFDA